MAKYLAEYETKGLNNREDLEEYLQFRKENDEWLIPIVRTTSVVGFDPLRSESKKIEEDNFVMLPEGAVEMAKTGTQMLLVFPKNFKAEILPVRYTAFGDIEARAGLFGPTLERMREKGGMEVLSSITKGQFLSTGLSLNGETGNLLLRDEMVNSFKSKHYQPFPEYEMVEVLEEKLRETFPSYHYLGGGVNHERLSIDYRLRATSEEAALKLKLESFGLKVDTLESGVMFTTSDVGNSAVTVYPLIVINGIPARLGDAIKVRHDAGNTSDMFRDGLASIGSILTDAEDTIEELGNTPVTYVANCVKLLAAEAGFAKGVTDAVTDAIVGSGTAVDVYIALMDISERVASGMSLVGAVQIMEKTAKLLHVNFRMYDQPTV